MLLIEWILVALNSLSLLLRSAAEPGSILWQPGMCEIFPSAGVFSTVQWGESGARGPSGSPEAVEPQGKATALPAALVWGVAWAERSLWFHHWETSLSAAVRAGNVGTLLLESSYGKGCPLNFNGGDCTCNGTNEIVCIALSTWRSLLFALAASEVAT